MNISKRLFLLASVGLAAVLALGLVGYVGSRNINDGMTHMTEVSTGLRNHMDTDMIHDALRADVLNALVATTAEAQKEVSGDVAEHSKHIKELCEENSKLPLGDEYEKALSDEMPIIE